MTDQNNPPAFPHVNPSFDDNWNKERQVEGMLLRDYFASAALTGMLSDTLSLKNQEDGGIVRNVQQVAGLAYKMADAMLAERGES